VKYFATDGLFWLVDIGREGNATVGMRRHLAFPTIEATSFFTAAVQPTVSGKLMVKKMFQEVLERRILSLPEPHGTFTHT
jgi:hypothetical protein